MVAIDAHTRPVTLLGWPIEHTLSPQIHNTGFDHQDLNFLYTASAVPPDQIGEAVAGLRALNFAGANVTIPHKERVIAHLDAVSEEARAVGAVNTIVLEESDAGARRLRGDNTDVAGFLDPLYSHRDRVEHRRMLVFGSGGAARAVAYALLRSMRPERLTLAARSPEKAEQIVRDLDACDEENALAVRPIDEAGPDVRTSRLLVNATPVGMAPETEASIWPHPEDFNEDQVAYDLVYRPRETRWLRQVADRGGTPIAGLSMLIAQAAASYRQWTGRELPRAPVRTALTRGTER